jgi:hypothetical protein
LAETAGVEVDVAVGDQGGERERAQRRAEQRRRVARGDGAAGGEARQPHLEEVVIERGRVHEQLLVEDPGAAAVGGGDGAAGPEGVALAGAVRVVVGALVGGVGEELRGRAGGVERLVEDEGAGRAPGGGG